MQSHLMAISRPGVLVSAISGTVGGAVFHQGARSGVIAKPARIQKSTSNLTAMKERNFLFHQRKWIGYGGTVKKSWEVFASNMPWKNRLGLRRPISGYNAYMAYALAADPLAVSGTTILNPPNWNTTQNPIMITASFTHGGPFNLTASIGGYSFLWTWFEIQTGLQYGPRGAGGNKFLFNFGFWSTGQHNIFTEATAAGCVLNAGDIIKIRMRCISSSEWPSGWESFNTTVT
jgi:hypothetical protein